MSRVANADQAKKNSVKTDTDKSSIVAQISNRFNREIEVFVSANKDKLALPVMCTDPNRPPEILTVKADLVRASVADMIKYTFEPWELDRKDSGEARKATFAEQRSQAALASKLMAAIEKMGLLDQLQAVLAEG